MAEENKAMELHGEESEKKKYISDVLDIDKLIEEYGNKIMLIAGVGSGKSTWVKDVLTQKGNVLFITSRRAKVDEDIAHSCFTSFVREQVKIGCLAAEGLDYVALGKQTGKMAAKILKGEKKASDMQFETITEPGFYVNNEVAKNLGITVPEDLQDKAVESFDEITK